MTGNPLQTAIRKLKTEYAQIRAFNRMDLADIAAMNREREQLERERFEDRVRKAEEKHGKVGKFIAQRSGGRGSGHVCGSGVTAFGV